MTITLPREEAQDILAAFLSIDKATSNVMSGDSFHRFCDAVGLLRARLSEPEPEQDDGVCGNCNGAGCKFCDARFLLPRKWQGLTDEEIEAGFMANTCCDDLVVYEHVARAIEAKLKEKNG